MATTSNRLLINHVRTALTKLQDALEALPDSAAIVSVYLPGTETCDGLVGGSMQGLEYSVRDAIGRLYDFVSSAKSPQEAQDVLMQALDRAMRKEDDGKKDS